MNILSDILFTLFTDSFCLKTYIWIFFRHVFWLLLLFVFGKCILELLKLKDARSLEGKLDSVLKRKNITLPTKVLIVKAMVFPVVVYGWGLDHKEGWAPKNRCFQIVVLEKTPEIPLYSKEIKTINPKEINPEYSSEGLKLQYFGHLMQRTDSLEKTLMLGKTEGRRRRERKRMRWLDSIADFLHMSLSKLWEIVKDRGAWRAAFYGVEKT